MSSVAKPSCEQIIDMLPEPFVVIDRDYRILAANHTYLRHYGVSSEEVVGRRCYEVSHRSPVPCSQHGEHCPHETVFATGQPTQVMHVHHGKNGHEEHVRLHASPILGEGGKVLYMGEYIQPVSQVGEGAGTMLIGRSRPLLRLTSLLQRVAPTQTTVLLLGESGVGKERVAEYIHHYSSRPDGPFVVVDCGALGENLIESELFGYEKGAFTGANGRKCGLFEAARGGTLFIDEVGELPLVLQTKLLRALETGTIRRIGGTEYLKTDVRIIVATNRDMQAMVKRGEFRQDLYYRLSAFPVRVPSLRERKDDIAALAEHFLARLPDGDRHVPLSPEAIEALLGHEYPGNVRELRNIVERAAIMAGNGVLRPEHLAFEEARTAEHAPHFGADTNIASLVMRRGRLDREKVLQALTHANGHRRQAASLLGVSERTLYRYVRQLRERVA